MKRSNKVMSIIGAGLVVLTITILYEVNSKRTNSLSNSAATHSPADVMFAQNMIPHHSQALEMAKLASTRAENLRVKQLALQIEAAQTPEIEKMTMWLKNWKEPLTVSENNMRSHSMSDNSSSGMMSKEDLMGLKSAMGASFDKMFLTMMSIHHKSAIEMAKSELSSGQYGSAKELAQAIIKGQSDELVLMEKLLGS